MHSHSHSLWRNSHCTRAFNAQVRNDLKKRGNCTQVLEKTFREGKGPNHFSFFFFFFFLASSSHRPFFPDLSRQQTFHPSYRLKTILTNQWFSISPRILVAPFPRPIDTSLPSTISFLSFTHHSSSCFYNFAPIFLSSETYITFSFSFLTPRQAYRRQVCVLSFDRPHPFLLSSHPKTCALSFSLSLLHRESTPRVYLSHNRNESRYLYIRRHMGPYGRKESEDRRKEEGACMTPLKIQTSDTSNK